jgi:periplasmic divalent cation tolerance protein
MSANIVVLVTCGSAREARRLGTSLVRKRLAACVNMLSSPVRSLYRWKGKVESAKEFLLLIKTTRKIFPALEREIQRLHSYDVPEIIALPIVKGFSAYLKWLENSVAMVSEMERRK